MTIESRGLIEPKDITAVEFECHKCKARLLLPLSGIELHNVPTACSRCNTAWVLHSSEEHGRLAHFLVRLQEFATTKNAPYGLRFEVNGLATPSASQTSAGRQ